VASAPDGRFVVVWSSGSQFETNGTNVFGQRYDSAGAPAGPEFLVNSYTTGAQGLPAVAMAPDGRFVVVWDSSLADQDGSLSGVFGQRYDSAGVAVGPEFRVNSYTTASQSWPSVATGQDGGLVVAWMSVGQDGSLEGIFGQRYDSAGAPAGNEFRVNSYTTGRQFVSSVAAAPDGSFVVVWDSNGQDGGLLGVFGQRYDSNGVRLGGEFRVNSYTPGSQAYPSVAAAADGRFVVVWQSAGQDGSSDGVFGQRYDAFGLPAGQEFAINSYTTLSQWLPSVASASDGRFVVAWASAGQAGPSRSIFAQRFHASGGTDGPEFRVPFSTSSLQDWPAAAFASGGRFVVAWHGVGNGDNFGIFGQRQQTDLVFADGFQAG
jgi:hypothetical protein